MREQVQATVTLQRTLPAHEKDQGKRTKGRTGCSCPETNAKNRSSFFQVFLRNGSFFSLSVSQQVL